MQYTGEELEYKINNAFKEIVSYCEERGISIVMAFQTNYEDSVNSAVHHVGCTYTDLSKAIFNWTYGLQEDLQNMPDEKLEK